MVAFGPLHGKPVAMRYGKWKFCCMWKNGSNHCQLLHFQKTERCWIGQHFLNTYKNNTFSLWNESGTEISIKRSTEGREYFFPMTKAWLSSNFSPAIPLFSIEINGKRGRCFICSSCIYPLASFHLERSFLMWHLMVELRGGIFLADRSFEENWGATWAGRNIMVLMIRKNRL